MYKKEYQKNNYKYRKAKQKKIEVSYKKVDYEYLIKPFADEMGQPVATVMKTALIEYIEKHSDPEAQARRLAAYAEALSAMKKPAPDKEKETEEKDGEAEG